MQTIIRKRGWRIALTLCVVAVLAYALLVQGAFTGSTFANGNGQAGIELTIDSEASYNGVRQPALSWTLKDLVPGVDRFFNFDDVKPGDSGENSISIHVDKNPAYVCIDFMNLTDLENGMNEPEALVDTDPTSGELADGMEFFAWHDDGDNIFELGEEPIFGTTTQSAIVVLASTTYALADATTGTSYAAGSTHYFGITWCAGDLEVNLDTAVITCDPTTMGNEAQTDSMSVDVILRAIQANENPGFQCIPTDECVENKGNNGHGNDDDRNDDSNPGNSNDPNDDTDDDGLPPGFAKKVDGAQNASGNVNCKPKGNNGHGNDDDRNDDSNPGNSNDPNDDTDDDGLPPGQQGAGGPPGRGGQNEPTVTTLSNESAWRVAPTPSPFAQATAALEKLFGKAKKN